MAGGFDVVIDGVPGPAVLGLLSDMFGPQHVTQDERSLRLTLTDQAAMIGALRQLHDLGVEIELVARRRRSPATSSGGPIADHREPGPG